jgi:hypothetical protein
MGKQDSLQNVLASRLEQLINLFDAGASQFLDELPNTPVKHLLLKKLEAEKGATLQKILSSALTDISLFLDKGIGIWIYGLDQKCEEYIRQINDYNAQALPRNKIRYIFLNKYGIRKSSSGLAINDGLLDIERFKSQIDSNIIIQGMLSYSPGHLQSTLESDPLRRLTRSESAGLGEQISRMVNNDQGVDGLHLDIEPYWDDHLFLMEQVRKGLEKPFSGGFNWKWVKAVNPRYEEVCDFLDFVLYRAYNLSDIKKCEDTIELVKNYLDVVRRKQIPFLVGLSAIAFSYGGPQSCEFQVDEKTGKKTCSGITIEEHLKVAIRLSNELIRQANVANLYLGPSIYAFYPHKKTNDGVSIYPCKISEQQFQLLAKAELL